MFYFTNFGNLSLLTAIETVTIDIFVFMYIYAGIDRGTFEVITMFIVGRILISVLGEEG